MYNSQYYTCEQIDERLLQGYLDDYNTQTGQSLTKAQFLTKLGSIFSKEGVIDNTATQIGYYECDTAAGTAAKAITVANYALFAGGSMKVKFANKNTANNATLNINSQGAKALYYQGERASATNSWDAEEVVEIYYDGTSYYANNVKGGSGSGVYDVSKEHPTSGPNSDGKFTLEYILNSSNVNELIPVNKRYPGMSIQFVSTSDNNNNNKYVQYFLKKDSWSIEISDWISEEELKKVINSVALEELKCISVLHQSYATESSGNIYYIDMQGCNCNRYDVNDVVGGIIALNVTRITGNYKVFYVFTNDSGNVIEIYMANTETLNDFLVVVPQNATQLYVNYSETADNVSVEQYKQIKDIEQDLYSVKETVLTADTLANNTYVKYTNSLSITTTSVTGTNAYIYNVENYRGKNVKISTKCIDVEHQLAIVVRNTDNKMEKAISGDMNNSVIQIPLNATVLYVNCISTETPDVTIVEKNNISDVESKLKEEISDVENELNNEIDALYFVRETPIEKSNEYNNIYANVANFTTNTIRTDSVSGVKCYMYDVTSFRSKSVKISVEVLDSSHNQSVVISNMSSKAEMIIDGNLTDSIISIPNNAVTLYINSKNTETPTISLYEKLDIKDAYEELDTKINEVGCNHRIAEKKCVCFGDSITWYDGHAYNWGKEQGVTAKGYESYLREAGMDVNNQGYSGATIRHTVNEKIIPFDFTEYDYVTITSGANDSRYGIPVGEIEEMGSTFDDTFIGRLQAGIEHILESNPEIKILLITPIRGWIYTPDGYNMTTPPAEDGVVEEKYADAIKQVADFYALPVCDWYADCGLNIYTRDWYINDPEPDKTATPNPNVLYSLHPSTKGYKRMAELLLPVIRNI